MVDPSFGGAVFHGRMPLTDGIERVIERKRMSGRSATHYNGATSRNAAQLEREEGIQGNNAAAVRTFRPALNLSARADESRGQRREYGKPAGSTMSLEINRTTRRLKGTPK